MPRTHTHPYDYDRPLPEPSPRIQTIEEAIQDWITNLVACHDRGLITHDEFTSLVSAGPEELRPHAAILPASQAHAALVEA